MLLEFFLSKHIVFLISILQDSSPRQQVRECGACCGAGCRFRLAPSASPELQLKELLEQTPYPNPNPPTRQHVALCLKSRSPRYLGSSRSSSPTQPARSQHQDAMDYDPEGGQINVRFLQVHRPLCCPCATAETLTNTVLRRQTTSAPTSSSRTSTSRLRIRCGG